MIAAHLQLTHQPSGRVLFSHYGTWLHPLLALTRYLQECTYRRSTLHLYDKVVGRAAALLIVYMQIPSLSTDTLSARALSILTRYTIRYSAGRVIEKLGCATENTLQHTTEGAEAYKIIIALAKADARGV